VRPNPEFITPYLTKEFIKQEQERRQLKHKSVGNLMYYTSPIPYAILGVLIVAVGWLLLRR